MTRGAWRTCVQTRHARGHAMCELRAARARRERWKMCAARGTAGEWHKPSAWSYSMRTASWR